MSDMDEFRGSADTFSVPSLVATYREKCVEPQRKSPGPLGRGAWGEVAALRKKVEACEAEHPPEREYVEWCEAGKPDVTALRKRVEELEISAGSAAMTIRMAQARAEKAEARCKQLESESIVKLCVCVNGDNPAPDCPCVICTVRRAEARAEKAEAGLAELCKLYQAQSGRPSQELLGATVKELTERAEKAERERDEARALLVRQQDITIDAFKRGDTLQADLDLANLKRCTADPPCCESVEALQADLDAALRVAELLGWGKRGAEPDDFKHVEALLEKRREKRG